MDVHNAFLQGELFEELFMELPSSLIVNSSSGKKLCLLLKSLYGLKQASQQFSHSQKHYYEMDIVRINRTTHFLVEEREIEASSY